ncbi:hypothetical protein [Nocardia sp. NPDC058497]|uniref:hypothetical protein n=1 Tax=Nocardia sp. NPDC058497 TaxID=3346529 RepID=UPI0036472E06
MTPHRPLWMVPTPNGGWGPPWPQLVEIASFLPGDCWTLIGGLMVQIHAIHAGLPPTRATVDVDMVLHIETGATTFSRASYVLEQLGYSLVIPDSRRSFVHRFERPGAQVDVMVADNLAPRHQPTVAGRRVFAVPAGTSALRKTVNCHIKPDRGYPVTFSIPDPLGALVLKGAAYLADTRDRDRHLEDAATLLCGFTEPDADRQRMIGSDRNGCRL